MQIKPNDNWCWYYDDEHNRMMLDLADGMLFRSRFARKSLTQDAFTATRFTVDDATLYYAFSEQCQRLDLSVEQQAELALNALTALRFLKPQMPKSWHFVTQQTGWRPACGDPGCVWLTDNLQIAHLLAVEPGDSATLCLLAQPELALAGRLMQLGDAIKIMNDRLIPFSQWQQPSLVQAV